MPGGCVGQSVAESNAAMEEKLWLVRVAQRSPHPPAPPPWQRLPATVGGVARSAELGCARRWLH
eukprot:COSAG01_NODE_48678_length_379_cov_0.582143_1_plen_63_part_10